MGAEPDEEDIEEENGSDDVHLLLFFYDCKTTGLASMMSISLRQQLKW